MTCNTIEKIEPALLRPGRIDLKIKLDYAAPEQIRGTFWRFMDLDDKTSLPLEPEERAKVEKLADRFVDMIPAYTITTAEMQGFFVDMLLEANANQWERDDVYERMFTRIPEFLEKVEFDREQAKKHKLDYKKEEKSEFSEEEDWVPWLCTLCKAHVYILIENSPKYINYIPFFCKRFKLKFIIFFYSDFTLIFLLYIFFFLSFILFLIQGSQTLVWELSLQKTQH